MDGMGEALGKAVRLFHYVPQANCLPGKTNYIMKLGQTQNFGHSLEKELLSGELVPVLKGWRRKPWIRNLVSRKDNSEWPELQTFIKWFKANEAGEARRRWTSIYRELSVPREAYSFDLHQDIS